MEWVSIVSIIANVATAAGIIFLAIGLWLSKSTLKAQTRAIEIQAYTNLNGVFFDIISNFSEKINDPDTCEKDLTPQERRALDRYFYLANMEYILIMEGVVDKGVGDQWKRGIKSAALKPVFAERWKTCASKFFSFDPEFSEFFEQAMKENQQNGLQTSEG
jgi:hypothetical protein